MANVWLKRRRKREIKKIVGNAISKHIEKLSLEEWLKTVDLEEWTKTVDAWNIRRKTSG